MDEPSLPDESIFLQALEIPSAPERAAYVDRACGADHQLRAAVEALLHAHEQSGDLLDLPEKAVAAIEEPPADVPGTVIGPYKLLEQIGEGGTGLVFMAEQTRPVRRKVALKVLKPGMDTRQVVARFEAERQALALMDHPHIAHVFDAGATASGRPYFVMELVRGVPITDFCDQRRLTTRERLELFVTVCQAVQHAHQKGIIHRDLKPSNVLVTLHDTAAVPKVIDFGIAKATSGPLTERTLFTNFAQMLGTPLYMSPEQAEMNGLDVDTRSDVYALGVLLYELLTGTTPFTGEALRRAGLDELRRLIREEEPPTPSQRLQTLGAQACSTVSERRGVDGRRLGQVLRGELDWIVMRALEKDRNRRYESASAFAADVQRYLNDEAVAACPPSARYRLEKFWRRNRRALVMVALVAAALVAATVVSTWYAVEANSARQLADERLENEKKARKEAATESAIARAVNDFLQRDLLGQVGSVPRGGEVASANPNLTVREALDRAAAQIGQRFRDQPLVEAAIRMAIGDAYCNLKAQALALPHFERAALLRQAHLGPDHPDSLGSIDRLAYVCSWAGRHPQAIALRRQILEQCRKRFGPDHPETLAAVVNLAGAYHNAGQWDVSIPLLEQVLEEQRTICGPKDPSTLGTMHDLALWYMDVNRLDESMTLHEQYLEVIKSQNRPVSEVSWAMRTYAQACQRAGKLDRADRVLRELLELARDAAGNLYVSDKNTTANVTRFAPSAQAAFQVTLDSASTSQVSVNYVTANGTAVAGTDYTQTSGTLVFPAGVTSETINVPITTVATGGPTKTFTMNLSGASGASISRGQATGSILNRQTKFFVVDSGTVKTYEYGSGGTSEEISVPQNSTDTAPRGVATTAAGTTV
jgi:serine/threonine protein kinase